MPSLKENRKTIRVVLAEDQGMVLGALAALLEIEGDIKVTAKARNGKEALEAVLTHKPDVFITDIEMPGMSGFELASAVRSNPRTADVPIIGLSSLVCAEAIERGRQVGLHDYVGKFDRQGLIAALKEQTADIGCAA